MTGLDIFAFIVMAVMAASILIAAVVLGGLPGKIAARRNHPQAEAIKMCGWIGILTLGLAWPIAFVWAYTNPEYAGAAHPDAASPDDRNASAHSLRTTIGELTHRIEVLETELAQSKRTEGGTGQ